MCTGRGSNQGPLGPKSDALTAAPLRHVWTSLYDIAFLAHLSRRITRRAYSIAIESLCVCGCGCVFTLSKINISATRGLNDIIFYLKHHWDWEKAALGFGPDRIRTLVSMATDSSHRL